MGVAIDNHVYDYFYLVHEIQKLIDEEPDRIKEGRTLDEFVEKVMPEFGYRSGDKFIVLWNEYYEDYNSGTEFLRAVGLYFGFEDVWFDKYETFGGANAYEVLAEVIGDDFDE